MILNGGACLKLGAGAPLFAWPAAHAIKNR
jgi:hypothetical protein